MRETHFIKQNKEKWKEFEKILEQSDKNKDPSKLNELFIQITDDLSYSRTFYPNRSVRVYLNNLAQKIFYNIYKNKRTRLGRIWYFWTDELPQLVYNARYEFMLSFAVFFLSFLIGVLSSMMDPDFPRIILGDSYVDMTIANIESGDPMAVYKERGEFGMSLGITANNLNVAFLTFVTGLLFGLGSLGVIIFNGVMVGAFQYFFIEKGVFWESFLTIWTHGTLEISAIIIAGAAGLTLGRGLAFPGTLTRIQSFQLSARRGLKIMLGIAPIIITAGFIEGYLTRYTETPDSVRLIFILLCLAFILYYFVFHPFYLAKQGFRGKVRETELAPDAIQSLVFDRIKSPGEIFAEVFVFLGKYLGIIVQSALLTATLYCLLTFLIFGEDINNTFNFPDYQIPFFNALWHIGQFFAFSTYSVLPIINTFLFAIAIFIPAVALARLSKPEQFEGKNVGFHIIHFFKFLLPTAILQLLLSTSDWYTILLLALLMSFCLAWAYISLREDLNVFNALGRTISLLSGNFGQALGLFSLLILVLSLFYCFTDSVLLWFFVDIIGWNLALEESQMELLMTLIRTFTSVFLLATFMGLATVAAGLLYHSLLEIEEAPSLKEKIKYIGIGKRIQGMEAES